MKRLIAILLLLSILAAGWMAGRSLARSRTNISAIEARANGTSNQPVAHHSQKASIASEVRNFPSEWAAALKKYQDPGALLPICLEWVKSDPHAALEGVRQLERLESTRRESGGAIFLRPLLFEAWIQHHGWEATSAAAKTMEAPERSEAMKSLGKASARHASASAPNLQMLLQGAEPDDNMALVSGVMAEWRESRDLDPTASTNWVESLDASAISAADLAKFERLAASARMSRDPKSAADWLVSRATPESLSPHLRSIVMEWAPEAPNACGEWLRRQPLGPEADEALEAFAQVATREDPASAYQWALRINDPKRRDKVATKVMGKWRIMDPAGAEAELVKSPPPE